MLSSVALACVDASLGGQGLLQRGCGVAAVLAASIRHLPQPIRHQRALLNIVYISLAINTSNAKVFNVQSVYNQ